MCAWQELAKADSREQEVAGKISKYTTAFKGKRTLLELKIANTVGRYHFYFNFILKHHLGYEESKS